MRKPEKRRWLRHFLPTSSDIRLPTAEKCHMCVECKHNCVVNIGNLAIAFNVRTWYVSNLFNQLNFFNRKFVRARLMTG